MKSRSRPQRVARIARKLTSRSERAKAKDVKAWGGKPLRQKEYSYRPRKLIGYDFETTRIRSGENPQPLYLTAFTDDWKCSVRVQSMKQLRELLLTRFLVPEFNKARFVAWNGNNFDVYIIAEALLGSDEHILRPYLTRSKNLRGVRVISRQKGVNPKTKKEVVMSWEFLDGISMTGLTGTPLKTNPAFPSQKSFLGQFAPEYDYKIGPDFEKEEFDPNNPEHVQYAERDSEGLYVALCRVEAIVREKFEMALQPTIGNLGIKLFQMNMPSDVTVWKPSFGALAALRAQVMRGGFCFRNKRYSGPTWKYDLNQAYAAAMREARLPSGRCYWNPPVAWRRVDKANLHGGVLNPYASVFIARVRGIHPKNSVPFYLRNMEGEPVFCTTTIPETWLTSIEYKQLVLEGAKLEIAEAYYWDESFSMRRFVDKLEELRASAPGGPSGPQGVVVKMIGNNSYGKTVERLDGIELVMALSCPEGFSHFQNETDALQCVWYKFSEPVMREYHQPQIGAFITAHVRMVLRRAILLDPDSWVYADTDCAAFSRPVAALPIHPSKYGLWKLEVDGKPYAFVEKKVYFSTDGAVKHAKGLNVKRLSLQDMEEWFAGRPPSQKQIQRANFVKFISGQERMFREHQKTGQRI